VFFFKLPKILIQKKMTRFFFVVFSQNNQFFESSVSFKPNPKKPELVQDQIHSRLAELFGVAEDRMVEYSCDVGRLIYVKHDNESMVNEIATKFREKHTKNYPSDSPVYGNMFLVPERDGRMLPFEKVKNDKNNDDKNGNVYKSWYTMVHKSYLEITENPNKNVKKQSDKPKRPLKAFSFFLKDFHKQKSEERKSNNVMDLPKFTLTESNNEAREIFNSESFDKSKYMKMAEEDKERYEREYAEWLEKHPPCPKFYNSPYAVYRSLNNINPNNNGASESVPKWRDLTDEQKAPYQREYESKLSELRDYCTRENVDFDQMMSKPHKTKKTGKKRTKNEQEADHTDDQTSVEAPRRKKRA
jgi:hypothetical protein